jgi:hypothetical protein
LVREYDLYGAQNAQELAALKQRAARQLVDEYSSRLQALRAEGDTPRARSQWSTKRRLLQEERIALAVSDLELLRDELLASFSLTSQPPATSEEARMGSDGEGQTRSDGVLALRTEGRREKGREEAGEEGAAEGRRGARDHGVAELADEVEKAKCEEEEVITGDEEGEHEGDGEETAKDGGGGGGGGRGRGSGCGGGRARARCCEF